MCCQTLGERIDVGLYCLHPSPADRDVHIVWVNAIILIVEHSWHWLLHHGENVSECGGA